MKCWFKKKNKSYSSTSDAKIGRSHSLALLLSSLNNWGGNSSSLLGLQLRKENCPSFSPLTSSCCFLRHWQQLDCFFLDDVFRLLELLPIPETDDGLAFRTGGHDTAVGALGGILTDDLADLPRAAFLQLGEDAGLERQRGHSEEKLVHVFP